MGVTEDDLQDWTADSGRDWEGLCQALMWNYCHEFGWTISTPPSAIDAYYASLIKSTDVWSAPPGSFIYFDIGVYGHVSTRVNDAGDAMASSHVLEPWGLNAGRTELADYIATTGAIPLGWSWDNAGNTYPFVEDDTPLPNPPTDEEAPMLMAHIPGTGDNPTRYLLFGTDFALEFVGDEAANKFIRQITPTGSSAGVSQSFFDAVHRAIAAGRTEPVDLSG